MDAASVPCVGSKGLSATPECVLLPKCLIREVLADGTCPLHVRLQLQRAVAGELDGSSSKATAASCFEAGDAVLPQAALLNGAAFLSYADCLAARTVNTAFLCDFMSRPAGCDAVAASALPAASVSSSVAAAVGTLGATIAGAVDPRRPAEADAETGGGGGDFAAAAAEPGRGDAAAAAAADVPAGVPADSEGRDATSVRVETALPEVRQVDIYNRIRARLWLQRLGDVTLGARDESVFDTAVRSYVDEGLRRRLEREVAAAKLMMEAEVREAKSSMLQCIQVVSEEVDRRVRENVVALRAEFDRRTSEQARGLQEMVERRVIEQTAAMQAEVDRRTESVRIAMEDCAREQVAAAARLRAEVAETRTSLEARVRQQEASAANLANELHVLRGQLRDLCHVRAQLLVRVQEREQVVALLRDQLQALGISPVASLDSAAVDATSAAARRDRLGCCFVGPLLALLRPRPTPIRAEHCST
eukprot:TRINITY_DN3873_c1_g3_i1.p1 TRINITY_DN3873_c1_g3~~TRINITY_DN3873_c1_g3_i1.p1  ORF type:complete len:476 (+),score=110.32 TRINITY_DN3873_c1_g3_i1:56-1483(+)